MNHGLSTVCNATSASVPLAVWYVTFGWSLCRPDRHRRRAPAPGTARCTDGSKPPCDEADGHEVRGLGRAHTFDHDDDSSNARRGGAGRLGLAADYVKSDSTLKVKLLSDGNDDAGFPT